MKKTFSYNSCYSSKFHTHSYSPFAANCLPRHNTFHLHSVWDWCKFLFEYADFPRKHPVHSHSNRTNRTTRRPLSRHKNREKKQNNQFFKMQVLFMVAKNILTTSKSLYLKRFLVFFWFNGFMAQLTSEKR